MGVRCIIFRVRVSIPNVLIIPICNGTLEPLQTMQIPISLKKYIPAEFQQDDEIMAKVAVECLEGTEEYYNNGPKSFWQKIGREAIRKTVVCSIARKLQVHHSLSIEGSKDQRRENVVVKEISEISRTEWNPSDQLIVDPLDLVSNIAVLGLAPIVATNIADAVTIFPERLVFSGICCYFPCLDLFICYII